MSRIAGDHCTTSISLSLHQPDLVCISNQLPRGSPDTLESRNLRIETRVLLSDPPQICATKAMTTDSKSSVVPATRRRKTRSSAVPIDQLEPGEKVTRVRIGSYEFKKKGVSRFDLRDPYHLAIALTWPQFLASLLVLYFSVNVVFAAFF